MFFQHQIQILFFLGCIGKMKRAEDLLGTDHRLAQSADNCQTNIVRNNNKMLLFEPHATPETWEAEKCLYLFFHSNHCEIN